MDSIEKDIANLYNKDVNSAYASLKRLLQVVEQSNLAYAYMETFYEMMEHENSYVRTRGIILLALHAKWDTKNYVDRYVDAYITHMEDEKAITSRTCIQHAVHIARYKPQLCNILLEALEGGTRIYSESMAPLIYKDRKKAIKQVQEWMYIHEEQGDKTKR